MLLIATVILSAQPPAVSTIVIDRDNVEITESCRVQVAPQSIIDADGNGVIHISASDINVEFAADSPALIGARPEQLPDSFTGTGIIITGKNVTLSGAKVNGFKVGIHARNADGLTIYHCDVSGNFAQRLKSTTKAEDGGDWLWPHNNDNNEWITSYGAGLCVEDSKGVTLHDIRARRTQNGIILDAVNDSKVYDCDCSFLSGWGLAMWRSSRNVISRNAFDFCVRGYSHGVYNRGQDSAGILMFEQCCENVIAENSCTHGGDGFFGFAGKEALGEVNPPINFESESRRLRWHEGRGCNKNIIVANEFSYAAAHGLELTFSSSNKIVRNRFVANAICGIWGGYSEGFAIHLNDFETNGESGSGSERGGVNIENGSYNHIEQNRFAANACGVFLWLDNDEAIQRLPWFAANALQGNRAEGTSRRKPTVSNIDGNTFEHEKTAIQLRDTEGMAVRNNRFVQSATEIDADEITRASLTEEHPLRILVLDFADAPRHGVTRPVGARKRLAGRHNIIMTEWGPWDHESPLLLFVQRFDHADEYRVLSKNTGNLAADRVRVTGDVITEVEGDRVFVRPRAVDTLTPYDLSVDIGTDQPLTANGLLTGGVWTVWTFASSVDPRHDADKWRRDGEAQHHELTCDWLDLPFGNAGMSEARSLPARLPQDHFGCIASRTLTFPKGKWRINTTSDDGIRVWLDDKLIIDDWTWHAPKKQSHDFEVAEAQREIRLRVEYFELDGFATLQVDVAAIQ